jgi:AcrR family transcriptional regulator
MATRTASKERLSRERILDTAVELAREDGPDALSMRRIAQELDVWPMSLYRHFRDKDELLDALAERAAEGVEGDGDLRTLLARVRAAFERAPGGGRLHREPALREAGMAALASAGLKRAEARRTWDALVAYAAGAAATGLDAATFDEGVERLLGR